MRSLPARARMRLWFAGRNPRRFLPVAVLLASTAAAVGVVGAEDEAVESHKRDLAGVEQHVRDLEKNLAVRRDRRRELRAELERHEREIAELARAGHRLEATIGKQEHTLKELRGRLAAESEALARERATLGGLLRSAYTLGQRNSMRILLGQEDSTRLSRIMAYYGFLNRSRIRRIKAVARRAQRLDELTREAAGEKARLVSLAQEQEASRTRLIAAQQERTELLTSLERTIATRAERVEDLRGQVREMRLLLEQLEERARALPEAELRQASLRQLRGRLAWPLTGISLQSRYGSLKLDGIRRWDGIVLAAEEGTEVRAIHGGQIAYADWLRGFGLLLIIAHDEDYMTLYGYNQTLLKEPGEWVTAGETIALSGRSGGRPSPELYFAIRYRGRPLNPERWLMASHR